MAGQLRALGAICAYIISGIALQGADIYVDSAADDGAKTLREAVGVAGSGDRVVIRVTDPILLEGPITISESIEITGQDGPLAHSVTRDPGFTTHFFTISEGAAVTISGVTLEGGSGTDGGAVKSVGTLTLRSVRLSNNVASGFGGAVYQDGGSLIVDRSYFLSNTAGSGGGAIAALGGNVTIISTGFEGNTASAGSGGAVALSGSLGKVRSSTFYLNSALFGAGGGLSLSGGSAELVNLTLVENVAFDGQSGMHIYGDNDYGIENSLIVGTEEDLVGAVLNNPDYNLFGTRQSLGLGDYVLFGGLSPVFPLLPGSDAIDGGANVILTELAGLANRDQRGLARFSDGNGDGLPIADPDVVDLGAFEVQLYAVSATQIRGSATGGADDGGFGNPFDPSDDADSIASADVFAKLTDTNKADIGDAVGANNAAGGGAVIFTSRIVPGQTTLKGSELEVRRNLAIYGPGAGDFAIDGDGRSRVFSVSEGASLYVQGVTIQNGLAIDGGGILVDADASVQLEEVTVEYNTATQRGGGIAVYSGDPDEAFEADIYRSSLIYNTAGQSGGAVFAESETEVFVDNSTISYNEAGQSGSGGGVYSDGFLSIESSSLVGNTAGNAPPAVYFGSSGSQVRNSLFYHFGDPSLGGFPPAGENNLSDTSESGPFLSAILTPSHVGLNLPVDGEPTPAHALLNTAGNPAINTGAEPSSSLFDQPGNARVQGNTIDIGSVEFEGEPPLITIVSAPSEVDCGQSAEITATVTDADAYPVTVFWIRDEDYENPVYTDTVSGSSSSELTRTFGSPFDYPNDLLVDIVAVDALGFSSLNSLAIGIVDNSAPAITAPTTISSNADTSCSALITLDTGDSSTTYVSATDLCSGLTALTYAIDDGTGSYGNETDITVPYLFSLGDTNVRVTAIDAAGNSVEAFITVSVNDLTSPTIQSVSVNGSGPDEPVGDSPVYTLYDTAGLCAVPVEFSASASDNCSVAGTTFTYAGTTNAVPANLSLGTHQLQAVAADASGNTSEPFLFNVVVEDATPPVLQSITVNGVTKLFNDPDDPDPIPTFSFPVDPGTCAAELPFSASATDFGCSDDTLIEYVYNYPDGVTTIFTANGEAVEFPNHFLPKGADEEGNPIGTVVEVTAVDANGNISDLQVFQVIVTDPNFDCEFNIDWPNALNLDTFLGSTTGGEGVAAASATGDRSYTIEQYIGLPDQSRWYKFYVEPGSKVSVFLYNLPEDYNLVIYQDIDAEYKRQLQLLESGDSGDQILGLLGAEFAPESFAPFSYAPDAFAPEKFAPFSYAPFSFAEDTFAPFSYAPFSYAPEAFSPFSYAPDAFAPDAYAPFSYAPFSYAPFSYAPFSYAGEDYAPFSYAPFSYAPFSYAPFSYAPFSYAPFSYAPESFTGAQLTSMIAFSAFPGVANEGVSINSYTLSGYFYIRVRGSNGAFSPESTFTLSVNVLSQICNGVQLPETDPAYPQDSPQVQSPQDSGVDYKTLVLWDSGQRITDDSFRMEGLENDTGQLLGKLTEFASLPSVMGKVIDLNSEPRVGWANDQADLNPGCPFAKNLVAEEIKAVIDAWWAQYDSLEYIVLVGNDDVIPFYRFNDESALAGENNYIPPVFDDTHSQSSLRYNHFLTQDFYGADCEIDLMTGPYPYPKLAVGRLVETVDDVLIALQNYVEKPDGLLPTPQTGMVTGYDFLDDAANAVLKEFNEVLGQDKVDFLIDPSTQAPVLGWTADELVEVIKKEQDIWFLAGHFSTASLLAGDYESRLTAAEVFDLNLDLQYALIFSGGCHSGYNTVNDHAIEQVTQQPDWPEMFLREGAIFIAGTGYQYGDTDFIEYGERLYLEFTRELRSGLSEGSPAISIGQALNRAKQKYLRETPIMRGIHEKTLLQTALYGLPMFKVDFPDAVRIDNAPMGIDQYQPTSTTPFVSDPNDQFLTAGEFFGLEYADVLIEPLLEREFLDLELTEPYALPDGSNLADIRAEWFQSTKNVTATNPGFISNPAEPVRPVESYLVSVDNTILRGVGFLGGEYIDDQGENGIDGIGFVPLTGAPTTEIRGIHGDFQTNVFFPIEPYSLNYFGAICGNTEGERLNIFPTQYISSEDGMLGGTMRVYQNMNFRLYYWDFINWLNSLEPDQNGTPSALAAQPSISEVTAFVKESGNAEFEITVVGSPYAGIQEAWITYTAGPDASGVGSWQSLPLNQDSIDTIYWRGELALPTGASGWSDVRFMVQAVSGTGMVALSSNFGFLYEVGENESLARIPTKLSLVPEPVDPVPYGEGAFGETLPLTVVLTDLDNDPLTDGNGQYYRQRIFARAGTASANGLTVNGFLNLDLPLKTLPENGLPLELSFPGDARYAPSSASTTINVTKQSTNLVFEPVRTFAYGSEIIVTLTDAIGTPLRERTVFFLVDYSGEEKDAGYPVITDYAGRADLSGLPLIAGTSVTITAYFNGLIDLPDGTQVEVPDDRYEPSSASILVNLADPRFEDALLFTPQQVDVFYKSSGKGKNATEPLYESASIAGNVAFNLALQPEDLLDSPDQIYIDVTVEAYLAGEVIASQTVQMDTRANDRTNWTTANLSGQEVSFVGIHWVNAPRFDTAFSNEPGPRIYTTYIGNNFSEIVYEAVPGQGNYETKLPDGTIIKVKQDGSFDAQSTALKTHDYIIDGNTVTLDVKFGIDPGDTFETTGLDPDPITVIVTESGPGVPEENVNYVVEGGNMIIRLDAVADTPPISSSATPNLFEVRFYLGSGAKVVQAAVRIGEGEGAVPWSSEDAGRKQYRP